MIIVRAPLRLTFGGAPTDLDSFSKQYGGFCISATINKYCYLAINRTFNEEIILKYSEIERMKSAKKIQHPIFREAIKLLNFKTPQLEIVSMADVPSTGAGLGNSGAFTVALLTALYQHRHISISQDEIAKIACDINIKRLKKAQGKQDEYASAIGGINCFYFNTDGTVTHSPLNISHDNMIRLQDNLMLFYTGMSHNTEEILKDQESKTRRNNSNMLFNLHQARSIGFESKTALEKGKLDDFGKLLNKQWENKRERSKNTSNEFLDNVHYGLLDNGAIGNKIVGSGGGGFIMVYANDKEKIRNYMSIVKMEEMRFNFDFEGCKRMI